MMQAQKHIALLQQHEKAGDKVQIIDQGKEPADFWSLVGKSAEPYGNVNDWNSLLVNVSSDVITF